MNDILYISYNTYHNLGHHLKPAQREVIQRFRQVHLNQQNLERKHNDIQKERAKEVDDGGHPIRAKLFIDGMTVYTCRSPIMKPYCKGDITIESRLIGVEVTCGYEIQTVFVYRTDAMVSGGANTMIEVVRQALIDLTELRTPHKKKSPKDFVASIR